MAKAVVRFFFDEAETCALVDTVGSGQDALRPEDDFAVSDRAGELYAFVDEGVAEAHAAPTRFDKKQAELGGAGFIGMLDEKDVAGVLAVDFGDPALFASGVEVGQEGVDDLRDEGFEGLVPSVLFGVAATFAVDDLSHVVDAMWAEGEGPLDRGGTHIE